MGVSLKAHQTTALVPGWEGPEGTAELPIAQRAPIQPAGPAPHYPGPCPALSSDNTLQGHHPPSPFFTLILPYLHVGPSSAWMQGPSGVPPTFLGAAQQLTCGHTKAWHTGAVPRGATETPPPCPGLLGNLLTPLQLSCLQDPLSLLPSTPPFCPMQDSS